MGDIALAKTKVVTVGPVHLAGNGLVVVKVSREDRQVIKVESASPVWFPTIVLSDMSGPILVVGDTIAVRLALEPESLESVTILEVHSAIAVWVAVAPLAVVAVSVKEVHGAVSVGLVLDKETVIASMVEKESLGEVSFLLGR